MIRSLLIIALLAIGSASYAADVSSVSKPIRWQTLRSSIAVTDTSTYDSTANVSSITPLLNPDYRLTAAVSVKFTNQSATCAIRFVRGYWDGVQFFAKDTSSITTITAPSTGTLRSLYVGPTVTFDMHGANAAIVFVDAPSAGSVDVDGGIY